MQRRYRPTFISFLGCLVFYQLFWIDYYYVSLRVPVTPKESHQTSVLTKL